MAAYLWSFASLILMMGPTAPGQTAAMGRAELLSDFERGRAKLNQLYWSPALGIWLGQPGDDLRAAYEGRNNPPWWPSANAVEVLADFMIATGQRQDVPVLEALYTLQKDRPALEERVVAELKQRGQWNESDETARAGRLAHRAEVPPPRYYTDFQNEYLDDSGWWALAWLRFFELKNDARYLATARTIHAHMERNWSPEHGGGILWCEEADKQRPNTITNTLFLILSARLYQVTHEPTYLAAAEKTRAWLQEQALFDGTAVVDAPKHRGDYWSYNQGTYLGGLTALSEATGRAEYLEEAATAAAAMLQRSGLVRPDGVLVEKLGIGGDAALFKGVFARYLARLHEALRVRDLHPELREQIERVLESSAASLVQKGLAKDGFFSADWTHGSPEQPPDFDAQVSGLALLVARLQIQPH